MSSPAVTIPKQLLVDAMTLDSVARMIADSKKVIIVQADNPDADSLGSALALEQLLGTIGKQVYLYCGVAMPSYLHHLSGWSRVNTTLPSSFDLSIIVDTSTLTLLEKVQQSENMHVLTSRPCIVLDHHAESDDSIHFATLSINNPAASSTGELIFALATMLGWDVDLTAAEAIASAILGDTQGLINESATSFSYTVMAALIELGVNRPQLEEARRLFSKMPPAIFRYKAELIQRTQLLLDDKLALVVIPQNEINTYSPLYNPAPLIQSDMLQVTGVEIAIVLKQYQDGKILGSIRCNQNSPIASQLALTFGGGGHPHAAGFKIVGGTNIADVTRTCAQTTQQLLESLPTKGDTDETIQYTF